MERRKVIQQIRFIALCFLLEKESMAAECHRTPQRALVKRLTRRRREIAREWALLQGLERTL